MTQENYSPKSLSHSFVRLPDLDNPCKLIPVRYDVFVAGLFKLQSTDLMKMHAGLGTCGEAGELADAIKKEIVYGKPVDRSNIVEELGDIRFYMQAVQNLYGISEQEVLQMNANKLAERYKGLAYSDKAAQDRADKQTPESEGN